VKTFCKQENWLFKEKKAEELVGKTKWLLNEPCAANHTITAPKLHRPLCILKREVFK
jgi:hypothetical protein